MRNDFVLAHISKKRIFVLIGLWKTLNENKMNRLNQQYSKKRDFSLVNLRSSTLGIVGFLFNNHR